MMRGAALLLLLQLAFTGARRSLGGVALEDGRAGWDTAAAPCPCDDASLCAPITTSKGEDVFAFHGWNGIENDTAWRHYDWDQISTVCVFGALQPEMFCHAHKHGARVTLGTGDALDHTPADWHNASKVDAFVADTIARVGAARADGFNIDIEVSATDAADVAALTVVARKSAAAMHDANPHAHVTYDVPSEGLLSEGGCGHQYDRDYNFEAMADALDFLVVMDYDSNLYQDDCDTCFYANAALPVVEKGVECFAAMGVPADKLVLAFPWYGYDYTCAETTPNKGACNVTRAVELWLPAAAERLASSAVGGGRQWDDRSKTPWFYYTDAKGALHRIDYDDPQSLKLKYAYAKAAKARGVGMWTANVVNYTDATNFGSFWADLKTF